MALETAQNPGILHSDAVSIVPEIMAETEDLIYKRMYLGGGELSLPTSVLQEDTYDKPFVTMKVPYSESRPKAMAPKEEGAASGMGYKSDIYYDDKYHHGKEFTIEDLSDNPDDIAGDMATYLMDWYEDHKYRITLKSLIEGSKDAEAGPKLKLTGVNGIGLFSTSTSVFHVGKATSDPGGGYQGRTDAQYAGNVYTNAAAGYPSTSAGFRKLLKEFYRGCAEEKLPDGRDVFGRGELAKPKIVILSPVAYIDDWYEFLSENLISWDTKAAGNVTVSNELPGKFQVEVVPAPWLATGYCYAFLASRGANRRAPLNIRHRVMNYGNTNLEVARPDGNKSAARLYMPDINDAAIRKQEAWDVHLWWNACGIVGEQHGTGKMEMA